MEELGWQDGLEGCTLASKLSSLGSNPDAAINCHPGVSKSCCITREEDGRGASTQL